MAFGPASATTANVAASVTSVTLFAATSTPVHGRFVFNDSTSILYLKYGSSASTTSHTVQIPAAGYWEAPQPVYRGIVTAVWAAATGSARTTEELWSSTD